ncbi:MAG: helix-turn-helix domain-containing protein [Marinosulfonomonas sp.]|nr:helix-turn-helix domain-containing protein [Marinosulfonomonas sp.]
MDGLKGRYKDVRALSRGIDILEALADLGWVKPGTLSSYVGLDRASVYRLVSTLSNKGYIMRRQEDGAVALTSRAARLADGVRDDEMFSQRIAPFMRALTEEVLWPSDFANLASGRITIQVSTHKHSPMSIHRRLVGRQRPLINSALGRAFLSALPPEALETTLSTVQRLDGPDAGEIQNRTAVDRILREVLETGYASSVGLTEDNISAIALPVRVGPRVVGALNIAFFCSAMSPETAAERHLGALRRCVDRIETVLGEGHKH